MSFGGKACWSSKMGVSNEWKKIVVKQAKNYQIVGYGYFDVEMWRNHKILAAFRVFFSPYKFSFSTPFKGYSLGSRDQFSILFICSVRCKMNVKDWYCSTILYLWKEEETEDGEERKRELVFLRLLRCPKWKRVRKEGLISKGVM